MKTDFSGSTFLISCKSTTDFRHALRQLSRADLDKGNALKAGKLVLMHYTENGCLSERLRFCYLLTLQNHTMDVYRPPCLVRGPLNADPASEGVAQGWSRKDMTGWPEMAPAPHDSSLLKSIQIYDSLESFLSNISILSVAPSPACAFEPCSPAHQPPAVADAAKHWVQPLPPSYAERDLQKILLHLHQPYCSALARVRLDRPGSSTNRDAFVKQYNAIMGTALKWDAISILLMQQLPASLVGAFASYFDKK